ncbi:conserved hypothetical protein [Alteromonas macleodii]
MKTDEHRAISLIGRFLQPAHHHFEKNEKEMRDLLSLLSNEKDESKPQ